MEGGGAHLEFAPVFQSRPQSDHAVVHRAFLQEAAVGDNGLLHLHTSITGGGGGGKGRVGLRGQASALRDGTDVVVRDLVAFWWCE